jgi:hypothetical protein
MFYQEKSGNPVPEEEEGIKERIGNRGMTVRALSFVDRSCNKCVLAKKKSMVRENGFSD